ncbi:30S ribosomal protein S15 [candidate division MSBL1 archaeon SCGC-AAA259A05]|uniref:30S ribosomal protein S15 n=1 Tax=candidate division MSBL1 archaeon SCGC-AAA259A05 TaxID=1698259 RepID=A0A133U527_9EURY|nr:30S ribosomal protein S15 [candidate division MSBL1 archaeon SCGC-AAA259A05]
MSQIPDWISISRKEIEETILGLSEEGHSPSEIGTILRDRYGVPNVKETIGKNILEILEDHDSSPDIPGELMNLIRKAVKLRTHLDQHGSDVRSQRALDTLESRIHRLTKYYKREGRLPSDWRYDPEEAALLVRG